MPLNLPASSATERRHDASSWRKEKNKGGNKTHFTKFKVSCKPRWLYTHRSGRVVSGTDAGIISQVANDHADRVLYKYLSFTQLLVTYSE